MPFQEILWGVLHIGLYHTSCLATIKQLDRNKSTHKYIFNFRYLCVDVYFFMGKICIFLYHYFLVIQDAQKKAILCLKALSDLFLKTVDNYTSIYACFAASPNIAFSTNLNIAFTPPPPPHLNSSTPDSSHPHFRLHTLSLRSTQLTFAQIINK